MRVNHTENAVFVTRVRYLEIDKKQNQLLAVNAKTSTKSVCVVSSGSTHQSSVQSIIGWLDDVFLSRFTYQAAV